uniref:V-type proton ATPase subunit E n=1 Tax=Romanomermis culicivorax TaxID=13658 RepID=A0A915JQN3_ROMCU
MGLSDNDVQKQLRHMMAFIEQEANEKAEEIDAKAEEEFNIEKGRLVQQQRSKIMEYYEKKEKQVELQRKIQSSNMLNQSRLKSLKAQEDHVKNVLDEARSRLFHISNDTNLYPQILQGLISQGLFRLMEQKVVLKCRQKDLRLVQELLPNCMRAFRESCGFDAQVQIDGENFLNPDCAGGVEVYTHNGKICVASTLESRLEMMSQQMQPEIRNLLFGLNQNRKFFE